MADNNNNEINGAPPSPPPPLLIPPIESTNLPPPTENLPNNRQISPRSTNSENKQQPSSPRPTHHHHNHNHHNHQQQQQQNLNLGSKSPTTLNTSTGVHPNKHLNTSSGIKSPPALSTSSGINSSSSSIPKNINTSSSLPSPAKSPSLNTSTSSDLLSNHHNHSLINYHNQQQHHHSHYPSLNQTQEQHHPHHAPTGGLPPLHHRGGLHTHDQNHPHHHLHHGNNTLSESTEINLLNESFGKTGAVLTHSSSGSLGHSRSDLSASTMMQQQKKRQLNEGVSPLLKNSQALRSSQNPFRMSQSLKGSQSLRASTASWIRGGSSTTLSWMNPLKFSVAEGHMVLASSQDVPLTQQEESDILASQEISMSDLESIKEVDGEIPYEKDGAEQEDGLQIKTIKSRWDVVMQKVKAKEGLVYMLFSAFLFSIMSLLVKLMSSGMQSMQLAFIRSFYGLIGCLIILYILKENPLGPKQHRVLLAIRGLSGTLSLCAFFYTLSVLPLSLAVVVSFTSPVITAALAAVVLKEKWGKFEALCAFLSLAGVTIVSKPAFLFPHHPDNAASSSGSTESSGAHQLLYILIGIGGAVFSALSFIAVRKIGRGVNTFVLVFYFSLVACIITLPSSFILQSFVWPDWATWGWLTLLGVIAVVAQGAVNRGIQLEKAAKAAAMNYLQIIFTFIWEISFLGGSIDFITVIGTLLILACAAVTAFKK
ncbi:hypothetical protein CYY_002717 [Polysphondylium violaceum]|uniref:EamA domain-containing protein n=1 Tax=Polysphondylium violaceum TaxID=133409 RepID=A0A8J4UUV5_9MYCE|nr:hypothetical protein CYY_002717 [Polysphondylium violaceum]